MGQDIFMYIRLMFCFPCIFRIGLSRLYPCRAVLPDNDAVRFDHLDRVSSGVPDVSFGHQRHQPGCGLALHVRVHRRREDITLDLTLDSALNLALDLALGSAKI